MAAVPLSASGGPVPDRAFRWSLAGHGLLLVLVLMGGLSLPRSPPPTQLAIKASVVDNNATRPAPTVKPKPDSKPEPKPEPKPDPSLEQRRVKQQEQEKDRQQAVEREKALREQQRTDQIKAQKTAEKQEKQEKEKREKQEKEKLEREKAAAEKLKVVKLRSERLKEEAAERDFARQLEAEEQLLAATESGALAEYQAMISQKVTRNWIRPPSARVGLEAVVLVTQIPGGEVISAKTISCNGDEAVCRSIEAAVLKASPLPLPDDPSLFDRSLRFTFKPEQ